MASHHRRGALAAVLVTCLTACSNYDFARARNPDGTYDVPKLMADLKAAGNQQLKQGIWIPLIYFDMTTFGPNAYGMPNGYTLDTGTGYGPLFLAGATVRHTYDPKGAEFESEDREWFGWGIIYKDHDLNIATEFGRRHRGRTNWLLLFGLPTDAYSVPANKAAKPANGGA